MTPPAAKGCTALIRFITSLDVLPPPDDEPPKMPPMPLNTPFSAGLSACAVAMLDSRNASDFSTSSSCLPPVVACTKALVIAPAKTVALTPSALVLVRTLSVVCTKSPGRDVSAEPKS